MDDDVLVAGNAGVRCRTGEIALLKREGTGRRHDRGLRGAVPVTDFGVQEREIVGRVVAALAVLGAIGDANAIQEVAGGVDRDVDGNSARGESQTDRGNSRE